MEKDEVMRGCMSALTKAVDVLHCYDIMLFSVYSSIVVLVSHFLFYLEKKEEQKRKRKRNAF